MSNLLEITGQDIAQLEDAQLRELIGLLCEADYRQAGLPTKGFHGADIKTLRTVG